MKEIRCWKKVFEIDLDYIVNEIKEILDTPSVIILSGVVGAGKTRFTQKFIGNENTPSPTYSIVNETGPFAHADFYRLKEKEELIHLELPLYLEGKDFFLVEWGRPYLKEIQRELGAEFSFYELEIEINKNSEPNPSRNYNLSSLSYL